MFGSSEEEQKKLKSGTEDSEDESEIVEESPCGRWLKSCEVRDVMGIDAAYSAMDTEEGVEVGWNEVRFSERENFEAQEEKIFQVFDNLIKLEHPNIVKFHKYWIDSCDDKPRVIFITEYMSSGSLKQFLKRTKRNVKKPPLQAWKRWCTQILSAISFLHARSPLIVHGNLTWDTIFIQHNGLIKIESAAPDDIHQHVKTCREGMKNTHFTAPEFGSEMRNICATEMTPAMNIFSFGMCALEMATLEIQGANGETGSNWSNRSHSSRFLTLHERRKKVPPTRAMTSDQALLDDLYYGHTHVLLARVSEWPFNAFALDRATGGRPLPTLCFHLFHQYGLMAHFHLDPVQVWKFFSLVEEGYHSSNPYHNAIHAADVTQAMHCFLQEEKMRCHLTPLEIAASLIAAMAHDLDHPGVNQPFLVATSNHLASLYKNASVLENHHWRSAMACLMESGMMDNLERTAAHELQRQIQSLILATDIARHQEFLSAFQGFLNNNSLDMKTGDHRHFMLQIALKCADICNPCRPWEVSRAWSFQVSEEFYRQGDLERRLGLPVTPLCDRFTSSVSKIQTGFFRFIAAPLFEEWHRFQSTPLSWNMLNYLRSNKLKWDSILNDEELGDFNLAEYQLRDPVWSELGGLEMGIEKIHLRRSSLPAGRSGLWTSHFANSSRVSEVQSSMKEDSYSAEMDPSDLEFIAGESHPPRSLLPVESHDDSNLPEPTFGDSHSTDTPGILFALPARLPHRRESLPFNFPESSRIECIQGRRESLPSDCSKSFNACDVLPELNITSMTPLPIKKEKRISQPNCVQPITSIPSISSDNSFGCVDEKENIVSTAFLKTDTSRLTLRRGSAPTALHPLNFFDIPRSKCNSPVTHFGRQGSLHLAKYFDQNEPGFRLRGSLPYELGRKPSGHESTVDRLIPGSSDVKFDTGVRSGSASSDLLHNTGASIASCWIKFRDRVKLKRKEIVVCAGTGLMSDNGCGFAVGECRRRSLRRRRPGGPELFASVVRRDSNFTSAHLPPLPQSATCTHAKLKRTLSPPESSEPMVGSGDCSRDWLLLGRRGSGALELLAGLWRQNRDRSERSSFESDDSLLKPHGQRLSMDSFSSSDGIPCSAPEDYCHLIRHGKTQRRGSGPADHSVLSGSFSANFTQLNSR